MSLFNFESYAIDRVEQSCDECGSINFGIVTAYGNTWEEILDTATVSREDWHGNELEFWTIGDLTTKLYDLVEADLRSQFEKAYNKTLEESC